MYFSRYLKLLFVLTIFTYAAPNAFDSLGKELEEFQKDCKYFQTITNIPTKIKKECKIFRGKVNSAFKVGYKVDELLKKDKADDKKLNHYLTLLRKANTQKEKILDFLQSEKVKARKSNNINYYTKLITNRNIKLYSSDYTYMEQHKDSFKDNERYLQHLKYLEYQASVPDTKVHITKKDKKKSSKPTNIKKHNDYSITSIKKIELYEENTDPDPLADDAKIYIVFGNSRGEEVRPPDGVKFDYTITIHQYNDTFGQRETVIRQLATSTGKLISDDGFTSVFIKLPPLTTDTAMLISTQVKLPSGKILHNKTKRRFYINRS